VPLGDIFSNCIRIPVEKVTLYDGNACRPETEEVYHCITVVEQERASAMLRMLMERKPSIHLYKYMYSTEDCIRAAMHLPIKWVEQTDARLYQMDNSFLQ